MTAAVSTHLGGFMPRSESAPHGDPWTWTPEVWDALIARFNPRKVLDVGCGEGHAARYFLLAGTDVLGIDGSPQALQGTVLPRDRFLLHDFTQRCPLQGSYDLVWSCEFVEHVEAKYMAHFIEVFSRASVVAMTHAFPGQLGFNHVNCQPPDYWEALLTTVGFTYKESLSLELRKLVSPEKHWNRSGMIFTKA